MKQTNVTHNIRVDKNKSNRAVYEAWSNEYPIGNPNKEYVPINTFGMAMANTKRKRKR